MKKFLACIAALILVFSPMTSSAGPHSSAHCAARMISHVQLTNNKTAATFEIFSDGNLGFRFFINNAFGWPARELMSSDGPYHGYMTTVISQAEIDHSTIAIKCS